jgi:hypothetical protein
MPQVGAKSKPGDASEFTSGDGQNKKAPDD